MNSAEQTAAGEYEKTSQENKITKATKEQDVKYKTKESKGLDKSTAESTGDRATVQDELDAVNEYYGGLKGRCIAKPESYEDRVQRRKAEIAGLKEALSILDGQAVLLQRSTLRGTRAHFQKTAQCGACEDMCAALGKSGADCHCEGGSSAPSGSCSQGCLEMCNNIGKKNCNHECSC